MSVMNTYLRRDIFKPTLVTLIGMLSIIYLMQSLRFMDLIVNKGLALSTFFWLTLLIVPSLLIVILPLSIFAGACFSFKRLSDDNELPPLFAAGLGRRFLTWPALKAAFFATLICYSLTLYFIPAGMTSFKSLQHDIRQSSSNILLEEGSFNDLGGDLMVYVKKRSGKYTFDNLLLQDNRDKSKPVTWMAEKGEIVFSKEGFPRLTLIGGIRQDIREDKLSVLEFERHTVDIARQFTEPTEHWRGREERFLNELTPENTKRKSEAEKFRAEWHKRLLWPLAPLTFVLIAAVCLLTPREHRHGNFRATAIAVSLGIGYQVLQMLLHNNATRGQEWAIYTSWGLWAGVCLVCLFIIWDNSEKRREKEDV